MNTNTARKRTPLLRSFALAISLSALPIANLATAQTAPRPQTIQTIDRKDNAISAHNNNIDWGRQTKGNWNRTKSRNLAEWINFQIKQSPEFKDNIRIAHFDTGRGNISSIRTSLDRQGLNHIWHEGMIDGAAAPTYGGYNFIGAPDYHCLAIGYRTTPFQTKIDRSFWQSTIMLHEIGHCLYYQRVQAKNDPQHLLLGEAFADYFALAVMQANMSNSRYYDQQKRNWMRERTENRTFDKEHYTTPFLNDLYAKNSSAFSGDFMQIFEETFANFIQLPQFESVHGTKYSRAEAAHNKPQEEAATPKRPAYEQIIVRNQKLKL